ncbi:hypothetical protein M8J76_005655 [Diaphorina citri]|nr:hypothetical protein M8J75_006570 [Diaphorina citri]KAI5723419.1 hypothetical protein M8J76_005655 [Diaphorina citri]
MKLVLGILLVTICGLSANPEEEISADEKKLLDSMEEMEKNLPTMDYNNKEHFESYIQNLTNLAMENDTYHELKGVKFGNRTVDNDLYQAMHNIKIKPDPNCYPPGFDHANYSGYINRKPNEGTGPGQDREGVIDLEAIMRELSEERRGKKGKRKRRNIAKEVKEPVANKEEQTNQIIRDMIVDDEYHRNMDELKNKIQDKAHIPNYLYFNFEEKDWYKRYKREINEAFADLTQNFDKVELADREMLNEMVHQQGHNEAHSRRKRDLGDYEKDKNDFTKQLEKFEINQANIRQLIDKGIGMNMQKAMKISIDYALKAYVNTSSNLDESVQRFFIMKQEYMNLIDKWYHGVVIDLPNYLKSQERKKINLSFDDDQPTDEERAKLNKLNEYERVVDKEFAEVGIHYGKALLNNYCDLDDLFYKYHRENNQCDIKTVFSEANTAELLKKEKIHAAGLF